MKIYHLPHPLNRTRGAEAQLFPFDVSRITQTIERALSGAGLDTRSGPLKSVTDTIQQALSAAGLAGSPTREDLHRPPIEGVASKADERCAGPDAGVEPPATRVEQAPPGAFVSCSFTNHAGTRSYKLYVPESYAREAMERVPMVVMLHGCTQSPDDFAAGTRMNALAEEHGFLVVYPAQAPNANGSRCWNWFRSEDQRRENGEPALIAGIAREVASNYRVDERRIFVAGLSAGAAMAVVLGATYPELFAAVGAHSGLPYRAAHDIPSAFGAMQGTAGPLASVIGRHGAPRAEAATAATVPTIVFHGDSDQTVHASNGAAIVEQATGSGGPSRVKVERGVGGSRTYTRTVYADDSDKAVVEHWVLHGAGHAWSGGCRSGSFTDTSGPDASAEMVRFFYSQHRAGTA